MGEGTYTAEGITAIAEMLKVNTTVQSIRCASHARFIWQKPLTLQFGPVRSLGGNLLKVEGAQIIANLLKTNTTLTSVECAHVLAFPHCQQPLTPLNFACSLVHSLLSNKMGKEGANAIVGITNSKPQLTTLCGIKLDEMERDFSRRGLDVSDAMLLAFDLKKNSVLVKLKYATSLPDTKVPAAADTPFVLLLAVCTITGSVQRV